MRLTLSTGQELTQGQLLQVRRKQAIDPIFGTLQPETMQLLLREQTPLLSPCSTGAQAVLTWQDQVCATGQLVTLQQQEGRQLLQTRTDLEFLQTRFYGGMYDRLLTESLMVQLLGQREYRLDEGIDRTVSGYLDICTRRQALEQLTLAQGGCLAIDPQGRLRLADLQAQPQLLPPHRLLSQPVLQVRPAYTQVEVVAHSYEQAQGWETIFQGKEFPAQEQLVRYPHPMHNFSLDQGIVLESGVNFLRFMPLDVDTLTVQPYLHSTAYHTYQDPEATGQSRVLSVRDNGLIHEDNAQLLLERLVERSAWTMRLQLRLLVEQQQLGDRVQVDTRWGLFEGILEKMDSTFTPESHVATVTIRGCFPDQSKGAI